MAKLNLNNFGQVEGMLVRDPYWVKTKSDGKVFRCIFTVCIPSGYKNKEGKSVYDYPEIQFEGTEKQFDYLQKSLIKGAFVKAVVTLKTKRYTDNDGAIKYLSYTECVGLPSIRNVSFGNASDNTDAEADSSADAYKSNSAGSVQSQPHAVQQQPQVQPTTQQQAQDSAAGIPAGQQWPQSVQNAAGQSAPGMGVPMQQWAQPASGMMGQPVPNMGAQAQQWTRPASGVMGSPLPNMGAQAQQWPQSASGAMNQPTPNMGMPMQQLSQQPQGNLVMPEDDFDFSEAFVALPDDMPLPFE